MILTEGIEDALSLALAMPERRVMAAVALRNMANVHLPPQITEIVIFADNDPDPRERGQVDTAVTAFLAQRRRVKVARSPVGKDANDHWRAWLEQERRLKEGSG